MGEPAGSTCRICHRIDDLTEELCRDCSAARAEGLEEAAQVAGGFAEPLNGPLTHLDRDEFDLAAGAALNVATAIRARGPKERT